MTVGNSVKDDDNSGKPQVSIMHAARDVASASHIKRPNRSKVTDSIQVAAAASTGARLNGPVVREELQDLFKISPSASFEEGDMVRKVVVPAKRTATVTGKVSEGEEDTTPLLQPILLHSDIKEKADSKAEGMLAANTTDYRPEHKSFASYKGQREKQTSKDAFEFIEHIIKCKTDKGNKGEEGGKKENTSHNNLPAKNKDVVVNKMKKGTNDTHIRDLSASPPRILTRESKTAVNQPTGQARQTRPAEQQPSRASRSSSRGRGAKQSASPTF